MFRQWVIFAAFLGLAVIVCVQADSLKLMFYVLFPSLLFPVYFYYDNRKRGRFFLSTLSLTLLIYFYFSFRLLNIEVFYFGFWLLLLFIFLGFQRVQKQRELNAVNEKKALVESRMTDLKVKHASRLESLNHLEKQVSGLLDLFEIARDFGECLSMEGVSEMLFQKVLPELPFKELRLIQQITSESQKEIISVYTVTADGVERELGKVDEADLNYLQSAHYHRKTPEAQSQEWIFPLFRDAAHESCLVVKGAEPDDLAKFEVLAAYLALQVKKVYLYETVKDLSIRDELTGVYVRRHFLERFEEEIRRSMKHQLPVSALMLDIDHFKRYNDDYGHLAGDSVLKQVTDLLLESLRKVDVVARYGGEEFVIVLPESHIEGALEVAERIRSSIARNHFKVFNEKTRVTVSIGVAVYPEDLTEQYDESKYRDVAFDLIQLADKALYRAKEEGRNRVISFNSTS